MCSVKIGTDMASQSGRSSMVAQRVKFVDAQPQANGTWNVAITYSNGDVDRRYGSGAEQIERFFGTFGVPDNDEAKMFVRALSSGDPIPGTAASLLGINDSRLGELLDGTLETASLSDPSDAEALCKLLESVPQRGSAASKGFNWRGWFQEAEKIKVTYHPYPCDVSAYFPSAGGVESEASSEEDRAF